MAAYLKPDNINNVWASGGDRIYPGDTKYATGWQVEIPPRQYFNAIDYKQDQLLAHLNQRGIPEWDAITEYQADKSYIQGSNGTIYRCILTHISEDPTLDVSNTYWEVAFANAGDFYLKSESDTLFMQRANNGSDIANVATFRTNISVYSQAQTYTKTEVDAKTTVASSLQAQQQTSNTVLLSALKLADAFKGGNQLLTSKGYQDLPGGITIQWGREQSPPGSAKTTSFSFYKPFTTICYYVGWILESSTDNFGQYCVPSVGSASIGISGTAIFNGAFYRWIAIGY